MIFWNWNFLHCEHQKLNLVHLQAETIMLLIMKQTDSTLALLDFLESHLNSHNMSKCKLQLLQVKNLWYAICIYLLCNIAADKKK